MSLMSDSSDFSDDEHSQKSAPLDLRISKKKKKQEELD